MGGFRWGLGVAAIGGLIVFPGRVEAGGITVDIRSPVADELAADSVSVEVEVTSGYQVDTVTASVGDVAAPLAYDDRARAWTGELGLADVPSGPQTLEVTVTDVLGGVGTGNVVFVHDPPPTLIVESPTDWLVARPEIPLRITCSDDDGAGCASVTVEAVYRREPPVEIAAGGTSLDEVVSLLGFEGREVTIRIRGIDSAGWEVVEERTVFVDGSPRLVEIVRVPGPIEDASSAHVLYRDDAGTSMHIHDRATEESQLVANEVERAQLGPGDRVLYLTGDELRSWNEGVDELVAETHDFALAGDWVMYSQRDGFGALFRRNLASGEEIELTDQEHFPGIDVAEDGTAIWIDGTDAWWYREVPTNLTPDERLPAFLPVTDGINAVFEVLDRDPRIELHDLATGASVELGVLNFELSDFELRFSPGEFFDVNAGWTAYADLEDGVLQIHVRSPLGVGEQVSIWGTDTLIDTQLAGRARPAGQRGALRDNGEVMLQNGGRRYLVAPGELPADISTALGNSVYLDDRWHVAIGRSLFAVCGEGDPAEACQPKGGDGDADADSDADADADSDADADADTDVDSDADSDADADADAEADADADGDGDGGPPEDEGCGGCQTASGPVGFAQMILAAGLCVLIRRITRVRVTSRPGRG